MFDQPWKLKSNLGYHDREGRSVHGDGTYGCREATEELSGIVVKSKEGDEDDDTEHCEYECQESDDLSLLFSGCKYDEHHNVYGFDAYSSAVYGRHQ